MPQDTPQDRPVSIDEFEEQRRQYYGIPKGLAASLRQQESGGQHYDKAGGVLTSPKQAKGRYQVLKGTAAQYGLNADDPFENVEAGLRYMADLHKKVDPKVTDPGERWASVVAGYHSGEGGLNKVNRTGNMPGTNDGLIQTQDYVSSIMKRWQEHDARESGQAPTAQPAQAPRMEDAAPIVPAKPFTRPAKPGPIRNLQRGPIVTPMQRQAQDAAANPFATHQGATGFQQQAQQAYERTQGLGQGRPQGMMAAANQFKQSALKGLARIPQGISEGLQMPVSDAERSLAQTLGPSAQEDIRRREGGQLRAITAATEPVVKKIEQAYPVDQADQSWMTQKIPAAAGSLVPMLAAAALGRGVGARSAVTSALSGAAQSTGEVSDRLNKAGVQGPQRDLSAAMAIGTGATEALGLGRALDKIGAKRAILGRLGNVAEDVAQEYGQEYLGDVNAKLVGQYDKNASLSPFSQNKLEAAALGGILGGTLQGAGALASRRPGAPLATPPIQPEPQQPMTRVDPLGVDARGRITGGRTPIRPDQPQQTQVTKIPTGADYTSLTAEPATPKADAATPATPEAAPATGPRLAGEIAGIRVMSEDEVAAPSQRRQVQSFVLKNADGSPQTVRAVIPQGMKPSEAKRALQMELTRTEKAARQAPAPEVAEVAPPPSDAQPISPRNRTIQAAREISQGTATEAEAAMREGRYGDARKALIGQIDALRSQRNNIRANTPGAVRVRKEIGDQIFDAQEKLRELKQQPRSRRAIENAPTAEVPPVPEAMPARPVQEIPRPVDAPMTEPTNRLRNADYPGGELQRTSGLRPEGQPVEIPADRMQENTNRLPGAEYAGGEVRRNTGALEGQPIETSARQMRPPAPPRPAGGRNVERGPNQYGPTTMSAAFPRSRRGLVTEGRRVQEEIEAGRGDKGEFGKLAQSMFKSTSGDVAHGQDSFFHDSDVKGALGLTRDAEQGEVRAALKSELARVMGVKSEEVSLTQVPPQAWQNWAGMKQLGGMAKAKLQAAIQKYQKPILDELQKTVTPTDSEPSRPVSADRGSEAKAPSDYQRFRDANAKAIAALNSIKPDEAATPGGKRKFNAAADRLRKSAAQMGIDARHADAIITDAMNAQMEAARRADDAPRPVEAKPAPAAPQEAPAKATTEANPREMNFTQFASERGAPSDFDILEHGMLGPSGHMSKRTKARQMEAHLDRSAQNANAKEEFRAAIERGEIVDAEGKITREGILRERQERTLAEARSQIDGLDRQIANIEGLGPMSHLPNGKLKASYQRTIDEYSRQKQEIYAQHPDLAPKAADASPVAETRPRAVSEAKAAPIATGDAGDAAPGGFDPEAFNAKREAVIRASREAGNIHLDKVIPAVETMRGKKIYYAHDPKVRGTIRTVDNRKSVYVDWDDQYSADKELATATQEKIRGKVKTVWRTTLGPTDMKDYVLARPDDAPTPAKTTPKRAAAKKAAEAKTAPEQPAAKPAGKIDGKDVTADEMAVYDALAKVEPRIGEGAAVSLTRAREEAGLSKEAFDKAVLSLASKEILAPHATDFPQAMSPEERAGLVKGEKSEIAAALRTPGAKVERARAGEAAKVADSSERSKKIDQIVEMAKKPLPAIREIRTLEGTDGNWYRATGFPRGVEHTGETRIEGYAFTDRQGVTFGQMAKTREELVARHEESVRRNAEDLRESLQGKTDAELQESFEFRKGRQDMETRLAAPIPPPTTKAASAKKKAARDTMGKAAPTKTTGSAENDARLAKLRERAKPGRGLSGTDELLLKLYETQEKADPKKWRIGDGVGWKVSSGGRTSQTNRGFRIVQVDPETKLALIRSVADTGLTNTGGDYDKIRDQWVHLADLVRDGKYNDPNRKSTTLGSGFGALQGMGGKLRGLFSEAPPKDPDAWIDKMARAMPEDMKDADIQRFDDAVTRAADAAARGDQAEWMRYSGRAYKILRPKGAARVAAEVGGVWSGSRAIMASGDLSAPLRQGAILTLPPSQWGRAGRAAIRMFKSIREENYDGFVREIKAHPDYELAEEAGLHLGISGREEDFNFNNSAVGRLLENAPVIKQSERAYKMYLDSLRMDTFAKYKQVIENGGGTEAQKQQAIEAAAQWINTATGRGSFGKDFDRAAPFLSKIFFAPRYTASRVQVLNPYTYAKNLGNPATRAVFKRQAAEMFQAATVLGTTAMLAKAMGATVETEDPDSPDWMKIKFGNTRYDPGAGLQQIARLSLRLGQYLKASATGTEQERKARSSSGQKAAITFTRGKLAPVPSFFVDWIVFDWTNVIGERHTPAEIGPKNPIFTRAVPLLWADMIEAYQEGGAGKAARFTPGVFGVGVQDYDANKKRQGKTTAARPKLPAPTGAKLPKVKRFGDT